ncbi:MAG: PQQ-like beta-propeller repeat protein [Armatimonadetes bacterium]|nr:PQQ-like beta-propeller repeat protein [Armatimonadota bacterium]
MSISSSRLVAGLCVMGVALTALLFAQTTPGFQSGDAVIVGAESAPIQLGNQVIATAKKGQKFTVLDVKEGWVGVEVDVLGEKKRGWINAKHLQPVQTTKPQPAQPSTPLPAESGEWTQWRGPNRDGRSSDKGLLKAWPAGGPLLLWKATGIGTGYSTVAVSKGLIYASGDVGENLVLTAMDAKGIVKWKVNHDLCWLKDPPGARGSPVVNSGKVYLLSTHGQLKCYDASDGTVKWAVHLARELEGNQQGWGYAESPLIYKDVVIVTPGGRNCIVALNKDTGKLVWASSGLSDAAHHSSCIAADVQGHPIIVQMVAGGMVGVDATNGRFLWRSARAVGGAACASPIYADGYCFGATGYGNGGVCVRLSVENDTVRAQPVWETKQMICHHGGYLVHEGYLYGNHNEGWSCLELATGKVVWQDRGVGKGSLCFADGMLYTFAEQGGVVGLVTAKPDGFEQTGRSQVGGRGPSWAYPVVIGGRLYLRYADNLYCFDVRGPEYKS